jgi:hypothetical protein
MNEYLLFLRSIGKKAPNLAYSGINWGIENFVPLRWAVPKYLTAVNVFVEETAPYLKHNESANLIQAYRQTILASLGKEYDQTCGKYKVEILPLAVFLESPVIKTEEIVYFHPTDVKCPRIPLTAAFAQYFDMEDGLKFEDNQFIGFQDEPKPVVNIKRLWNLLVLVEDVLRNLEGLTNAELEAQWRKRRSTLAKVNQIYKLFFELELDPSFLVEGFGNFLSLPETDTMPTMTILKGDEFANKLGAWTGQFISQLSPETMNYRALTSTLTESDVFLKKMSELIKSEKWQIYKEKVEKAQPNLKSEFKALEAQTAKTLKQIGEMLGKNQNPVKSLLFIVHRFSSILELFKTLIKNLEVFQGEAQEELYKLLYSLKNNGLNEVKFLIAKLEMDLCLEADSISDLVQEKFALDANFLDLIGHSQKLLEVSNYNKLKDMSETGFIERFERILAQSFEQELLVEQQMECLENLNTSRDIQVLKTSFFALKSYLDKVDSKTTQAIWEKIGKNTPPTANDLNKLNNETKKLLDSEKTTIHFKRSQLILKISSLTDKLTLRPKYLCNFTDVEFKPDSTDLEKYGYCKLVSENLERFQNIVATLSNRLPLEESEVSFALEVIESMEEDNNKMDTFIRYLNFHARPHFWENQSPPSPLVQMHQKSIQRTKLLEPRLMAFKSQAKSQYQQICLDSFHLLKTNHRAGKLLTTTKYSEFFRHLLEQQTTLIRLFDEDRLKLGLSETYSIKSGNEALEEPRQIALLKAMHSTLYHSEVIFRSVEDLPQHDDFPLDIYIMVDLPTVLPQPVLAQKSKQNLILSILPLYQNIQFMRNRTDLFEPMYEEFLMAKNMLFDKGSETPSATSWVHLFMQSPKKIRGETPGAQDLKADKALEKKLIQAFEGASTIVGLIFYTPSILSLYQTLKLNTHELMAALHERSMADIGKLRGDFFADVLIQLDECEIVLGLKNGLLTDFAEKIINIYIENLLDQLQVPPQYNKRQIQAKLKNPTLCMFKQMQALQNSVTRHEIEKEKLTKELETLNQFQLMFKELNGFYLDYMPKIWVPNDDYTLPEDLKLLKRSISVFDSDFETLVPEIKEILEDCQANKTSRPFISGITQKSLMNPDLKKLHYQMSCVFQIYDTTFDLSQWDNLPEFIAIAQSALLGQIRTKELSMAVGEKKINQLALNCELKKEEYIQHLINEKIEGVQKEFEAYFLKTTRQTSFDEQFYHKVKDSLLRRFDKLKPDNPLFEKKMLNLLDGRFYSRCKQFQAEKNLQKVIEEFQVYINEQRKILDAGQWYKTIESLKTLSDKEEKIKQLKTILDEHDKPLNSKLEELREKLLEEDFYKSLFSTRPYWDTDKVFLENLCMVLYSLVYRLCQWCYSFFKETELQMHKQRFQENAESLSEHCFFKPSHSEGFPSGPRLKK